MEFDYRQIRYHRRAAAWTLCGMAKAIGVSVGAYYKYENGSVVPRADVLARIATKLDLHSSELFTDRMESVEIRDFTQRLMESKRK